MTSRFTGKNLKINHMIILELLHFLENLKFQPYVSNTSAALVCFLIDNTAMFMGFFCLVTQCTLKFKCCQKSTFIERNTRAGNQKKRPDVPFDCY